MKRYKYINCDELIKYDNWEIVKIIEGNAVDRAVIMKEDKNYIKLHEATKEQLLGSYITCEMILEKLGE